MPARQSDEPIAVLIAAAGSGSRMGGDTPKQYLPLAGSPVLLHALRPFIAHSRISRIVIVHDARDRHLTELSLSGEIQIECVVGGATRAASVRSGLTHLLADENPEPWVMVHDAARPLITEAAIDRLLQWLDESTLSPATTAGGALLALPVTDTIKIADAGHAVKTPDRATLWAAQTPQLFPTMALHQALSNAERHGVTITDEASAMEHSGYRPTLVTGDTDNFKITHPDDLVRAQLVLAGRNNIGEADASEESGS